MTRLLLALTLAVALAGAALRLAGARSSPGTFDEVSFTAALERWDLLAFEPHFPGYALTVLLARGAHLAGAPAAYAAVAAALCLPAALAARALGGPGRGGLLAAAIVSLAPLAVVAGARPMADATATALLCLALAAAWRAHRTSARRPGGVEGARASLVAGLLLGATAAAKPDLLPFASAGLVPALLRARSPGGRREALALVAGLALPLALATLAAAQGTGGAEGLAREARRFLTGHALSWGGGVLAPAAAQGTPRAVLLGATISGAAGGGTGAAGLLVGGGVLGVLALQAPRSLRRAALVAGLPYGLWLVLGQNLADPRHALPLLPLVAALAGRGLERLAGRARGATALGLALGLAATTGSIAALARADVLGRPADRLCALVAAQDPLRLRVYGGASTRVLRERLPAVDARRARTLAQVDEDLAADPCPPDVVWVTSEVEGAVAAPPIADVEGLTLHAAGAAR